MRLLIAFVLVLLETPWAPSRAVASGAWTSSGPPGGTVALVAQTSGAIWMAGRASGLFRSLDSERFESVPLFTGLAVRDLISLGTAIYVRAGRISDYGDPLTYSLYRSSDGGTTWTGVSLPEDGNVRGIAATASGSIVAAVRPARLAGTPPTSGFRPALFTSEDGVGWIRRGLLPFEEISTGLGLITLPSGRLIAWTYGTFAGSDDGGATWSISGRGWDSLVAGPSGTLWATRYRSVARSNDDGLTFSQVLTDSLDSTVVPDAADPSRLWAVQNGRTMLRTDDAGESWIDTTMPETGAFVASVKGESGGVLIAFGLNFYLSGDGGMGWRAVSYSPPPAQVLDLAYDSGTIYLLAARSGRGGANRLWFSVDWGGNWRNIDAPGEAMTVTSGGGSVFLGGRGRVWKSAGDGWIELDERFALFDSFMGGNPLRGTVRALRADPAGRWLVVETEDSVGPRARYRGVWTSEDQGQTFQKIEIIDSGLRRYDAVWLGYTPGPFFPNPAGGSIAGATAAIRPADQPWRTIDPEVAEDRKSQVTKPGPDRTLLYDLASEGSLVLLRRGNVLSADPIRGWRSSDGGQSWNRLPLLDTGPLTQTGLAPAVAAVLNSAGQPVVAVADRGVFRLESTEWVRIGDLVPLGPVHVLATPAGVIVGGSAGAWTLLEPWWGR